MVRIRNRLPLDVLVLLLSLGGCGGRGEVEAPAPTGDHHPSPSTVVNGSRLVALDCGDSTGDGSAMTCGGLRQTVSATGTVRAARDWLPSRGEVSFVRLPDSAGGGLVLIQRQSFQTSLWRAANFTAEVRPLVALPIDADQAAFGLGRLYLIDRKLGQLLAVDVDTGARVDLGPLPYTVAPRSLGFASANVGAVETEVRGVLVTRDAGATWAPLGEPTHSPAILEVPGGIEIRTKAGRKLLEPGGTFRDLDARDELERRVRRTGAATHGAPARERRRAGTGQILPGSPGSSLQDAAAYGVPGNAGDAYVLRDGTLSRVRLEDGRVLESVRSAGQAGPCPAVEFGDTAAFVCSRGAAATVVYEFAPPMGVRRLKTFEGPRAVTGGPGGLVVAGGCGEARSGTLCVLPASGVAWQYEIPGYTGGERHVLGSDGALRILRPAAGKPEVIRVERVEPSGVATVQRFPVPDTEGGLLLRTGAWLSDFYEVPGGVGGWVVSGESFVGVRLSDKGDLEFGVIQTPASSTTFAGPRAFVLRQGAAAFETRDGGRGWVEVPLPVAALEDAPHRAYPRGCTNVGCALGRWVRIGWGEGAKDDRLPTVAMPQGRGDAGSGSRRWNLECRWVRTGGSTGESASGRRRKLPAPRPADPMMLCPQAWPMSGNASYSQSTATVGPSVVPTRASNAVDMSYAPRATSMWWSSSTPVSTSWAWCSRKLSSGLAWIECDSSSSAGVRRSISSRTMVLASARSTLRRYPAVASAGRAVACWAGCRSLVRSSIASPGATCCNQEQVSGPGTSPVVRGAVLVDRPAPDQSFWLRRP